MSYFSRAKQIGQGVVFAGAVTAFSLTTMPTAAQANGPGVGAAIGLGILGGAIAGAAIASSVPPVYATLAPVYYYPPGYYPAPVFYPAALLRAGTLRIPVLLPMTGAGCRMQPALAAALTGAASPLS
jgi:hypothetical protein